MDVAPSRPALRVAPVFPSRSTPAAALAPAEREALAAAWSRDAGAALTAARRYASMVEPLAAAGAPASLVEGVRRAARAASAEAGRAARLAARWGGPALRVGRVREGAVELARWVVERCVADTIAVAEAAARLASATDPEVRGALSARLRGLGRSASVAWQVARWAAGGGGSVGVALPEGPAGWQAAAAEGPDIVSAALRAHGVAPRGELDAVRRAALVAVVWPAAAGLRARPDSGDGPSSFEFGRK